MAAAATALAGREHHLPSDRVFAVTGASRLSAYDAEFVALAEILGAPLVTEDRAILRAFPRIAASLEAAIEDHQIACGTRSGRSHAGYASVW
jgi:hypothetical protein